MMQIDRRQCEAKINKILILRSLKYSLYLVLTALLLNNTVICAGSAEGSCSEPTDHFTYPDNAPNINVFHMVVIGDSIAWGEGLNRNEKYYYLVAKWLNSELNRPIEVTVYAHNAAKLESSPGPECTYPECTNSNPSILKQADLISDPEKVNLILVSGGINDVDVLGNIGNIDIDSSEIRKITREKIKEPMTKLLKNLLTKSENAKIIVTGYYRIITDGSHDFDIGLIYPKLYKETHNGKDLPESMKLEDYKQLLIKNSEAFWDESNKCLAECVSDANSDHVVFSPVDFPIPSSVAAKDTWLWNIDYATSFANNVSKIDEFPTNDHKYNERKDKCKDSLIDLDSAFAHPNTKGAEQYRDAIKSSIDSNKLIDDIKPVNDYIIFPPDAKRSDAFHIAVIGDSIAWGNGLREENKSYYQVADWLHKMLNIPVDVTVYAHSGAIISGSTGKSINPNLNSAYPTLEDQATNIQNNVNLILVSGGINDVGVNNLLDANTPTETISEKSLSIEKPMENLLNYLLQKTDAKIIVTGYYPIITEESKIEPQDRAVAGVLASLSEKTVSQSESVLIAALTDPTDAKLQAALYLVEGIANNVDNYFEEDSLLRANSDTFYGISSNSLDDAVRNSDRNKSRIRFVDPMFERDNSYRASNSFLWELNKDKIFTTNDDQYEERVKLTKETYSLDLNPLDLDLIKQAENNMNSIAHPNNAGATKYAQAIESALKKYISVKISVFNSAGLPAEGAAVSIDGVSNYTTDLKGNLSVILPDGNHTINASKPGYGIGNWSDYFNHTEISSINITLRPIAKHPFDINVVNSANFSLEGAMVMADGVLRGRTGSDGTIRIELTDENHIIFANKTNYGSGNWTGKFDHNKMSGVVVMLNGSLEYPFNVIVTNAVGYTMEGANVSVDGIMKGATDSKGEIKIFLVEGKHAIVANKTDYGSGNWTGVLNYTQFHEVAVKLNGALEYPFNVTVVNAANYTTDGAVISVAGVNKGVTDRQGRLRAWLTEGNQTINAVKPGYGSGNWTGTLNHSIAQGVVVQLNGSLEYPLNLTIVNPAKYTVPGADIMIDGIKEGQADANGAFTAMLSDGNHTIEANKTGYSAGNRTIYFNHSLMNGLAIELGSSSIMINQKPIDLCMVLDTSGSMTDPECADTSKIEAVKKAAEDTIAGFFYPGTTNRIAVVSFSDTSSTISEFTNNYFDAYANVSQLYASGATSFGLGLGQAVYEFSRTNRTDHIPVILFMSDGMHNTPPDYGYYLARCMFMGIRVYTVGYGSEADHDLLKEMAMLSGGEYLFADPCGDENSQIQSAFMRLQMNLSGWKDVMNISGSVAQNQTVNATGFVVSKGSPYVIVNVVYPGSHLKISLIGPDGNPVNSSDYSYTESQRVISIRMKEPKPGNYAVQVYGDQVDGVEPYTIYISSKYVAPSIPSISQKSIVVKETSGDALINYPVKISISSKDFPQRAEENGSDINILDQNGRDLSRWIESWDSLNRTAVIWVKVPEIPANGEVHLTMLTGNPGEPAKNSGFDVFDFFDDFDGPSIDQNNWTSQTSGNGSINLQGGIAYIRAPARSTSTAELVSKIVFSSPIAVRFKANASAGQDNDWKLLGLDIPNADRGLNMPKSSVCFNGIGPDLFSYHSLPVGETEKSGKYPVKLAYLSQNRTWEILWHATGIDFDPSGGSKPHQLSGPFNESLPLFFGINATVSARPSEIDLDWVSAWRCASKEPLVLMI